MTRLAQPLSLPCGARLPNRLCKSAMTEGLSDPRLYASERHNRLYRQWSEGGAGLLISGNVMIDKRVMERPGNVAIDPASAYRPGHEGYERLRAWAQAGTVAGNHLWMQISHAGRQSPWYVAKQPLAPSEVQLDLMGNYRRPRALSEAEILDFIQRYAAVARVARETGFTGVQIHSAHGYLLSSFLSPVTNQRQDAWGGPLENRARFLLETLRAVRKAVGPDFPLSVKLNSDDFRKGGFEFSDCLQLVQWLNTESVDLLEVSGGTYEQPKLLGYEGRTEDARPARQSTQQREAYFLEYAAAIRKVATMPILMPGGFRHRAAMEAALESGDIDVIGLARPLCTEPDLPKRLLSGASLEAPAFEKSLKLGGGMFAPSSGSFVVKLINLLGQMGWYYAHIEDLADGKPLNLQRGVLAAFLRYLKNEYGTAWRMRRS
ncbi:NADH:flavin oxidoreductase/NADH oxidase family protein [Stagnimonas aquatica]|uniref:NADH:flavin oxidoreductase/NADH oxidase family protein n=1 Tax=Stagnimonas aquatica TaxID=2689987 RepID=A0A3N0VLT0_9GAMM|nr:NADH:flavin oxidoreductase/NADH oxidase family protein [Stagnimonas aquatica]ROH93684.1 NADH:flavin oxidoreductase/NADH oxidase family protein [Stagnimonas aquatica]